MVKYSAEDISRMSVLCKLDMTECLRDIGIINSKIKNDSIDINNKEKRILVNIMRRAERYIKGEGILNHETTD